MGKATNYEGQCMQSVTSLLAQSKETCLRNFGRSTLADWIYKDLAELLQPQESSEVDEEPQRCWKCGELDGGTSCDAVGCGLVEAEPDSEESPVQAANPLGYHGVAQQDVPDIVDRSDAVNSARNVLEAQDGSRVTPKGVLMLCQAVMAMDEALTKFYAQPTHKALVTTSP